MSRQEHPDQRSVLLDAYNLAMPAGTGIATYARGLNAAVQGLGHQAHILYGLSEERASAADFTAGLPRPLRWATRRLRRSLQRAAGLIAAHGPINARALEEEADATGSNTAMFPGCQGRWNVKALYDRANLRYGAFESFTPVRLPTPIDIAHWTCPIPVRARNARNIYTIHDLVPLRLPGASLGVERFKTLVEQIAASADHIVTVSECSRQDIINLLGISSDRVTNTYQSVEWDSRYDAVIRANLQAAYLDRYRLQKDGYLLFFGAIEPKKNLLRLLQAYRSSGSRLPLVIVGKLGWSYEGELELLEDMGCQDLAAQSASQGQVLRLDHTDRDTLVALILGARAVLFPSLYEGFGLPVLEAMLLGAPVLTSTAGSLPEVAGDAALLVDPYDVGSIAAGLEALESDSELRRKLSARGRIQAQRFSRAAHQQKLADLYEAILESPPQSNPP